MRNAPVYIPPFSYGMNQSSSPVGARRDMLLPSKLPPERPYLAFKSLSVASSVWASNSASAEFKSVTSGGEGSGSPEKVPSSGSSGPSGSPTHFKHTHNPKTP